MDSVASLEHENAGVDLLDVRVQNVKDLLLLIPIAAHDKALKLLGDAKTLQNTESIAVYEEVVRQLEAEGYAPDVEGGMGPATKRYYGVC